MGFARTATHSFHTHHLRIISASIVAAHAEMLILAAVSLSAVTSAATAFDLVDAE